MKLLQVPGMARRSPDRVPVRGSGPAAAGGRQGDRARNRRRGQERRRRRRARAGRGRSPQGLRRRPAGQVVSAVKGVSLELHRGRVVALVGESGSGKSTIAKLLAGQEKRTGGSILLDGQEIEPSTRGHFRAYKSEVQMVFQDPFASLNPLRTVRYHLQRALTVHASRTGREPSVAEVDRLLEPGQAQPGREVPRRLPARAVRWSASARLDRTRAGRRAARAARRRAGLDARRLDPAGDP